jgi:heme-degrading monooxygenase HmoA
MRAMAYTLAMWRVKKGYEKEFIRRWKEELGEHFRQMSADTHGTLIRSVDDPTLFYSFGPWKSQRELKKVRADPKTQHLMGRVLELCDEARPGVFELVLTVP